MRQADATKNRLEPRFALLFCAPLLLQFGLVSLYGETMGMVDVTADAVRLAIKEFDDLGRDPFLTKYGFGRARDYFIVVDDRKYDSKAIIGAAHRFVNQAPLTPKDFSGGDEHAARHLQRIGFVVTAPNKATTRRIGKQAMIEQVGAKLTNVRWGWDGSKRDGSVVFIGWDYRAERNELGEIQACEIFQRGSPHNDGPGGRERARHIDALMQTDSAGFLVLATPKDRAMDPHEIAGVDECLYSVKLENRGDFVYARVIGSNSLPGANADLAADIEGIVASTSITAEQRSLFIQARCGQGLFRNRVELVERSCRVTGIADRGYLLATHIKPWRDCVEDERLDGANGLLLAPHVKQLFDNGMLSFTNAGQLITSGRIPASLLSAWNVQLARAPSAFNERQLSYIQYHREQIFVEA